MRLGGAPPMPRSPAAYSAFIYWRLRQGRLYSRRDLNQREEAMAGSIATRDWEALEMTDMIGQNGHITVTGEVELTDTGTTAELKEHVPSGFNPKILLLDLVIHRHGGVQGHIAWFEKLSFKMKSSGHAYDEVDILYGGDVIQRVKVEHPLTFAAPPAASPAKKAPAKKKPAKAAAAKKKAAKTVAKKKPAKKAAKKAVKKSVKKSAKTAAKKKSAKKKSGKKKK